MKRRLGILLILTLVVGVVLVVANRSFHRGRLRLPVGQRPPAISLGFSHGLILASDGSLWVWGDEELGWPVLGLGKINSQRHLRRLNQETNWVNISAGEYHNFAVKADGTLWSWGGNFRYILGDGTKTDRNTPVQVLPGHDWKQAAAGAAYSVALKQDGTLWSWGANWAGQLGLGSTSNNIDTVTQVGSGTNWTRIWAQGVQTVAQQLDGSLWFCGTLTGSDKDTDRMLIPTLVSPDTNWVDVCFGCFTVLAIKSDGTLWAWGRDAQDYAGAETDTAPKLTPRRIGTNDDWVACSSFGTPRYHLLKKKDGSLWELRAPDQQSSRLPVAGAPLQFDRVDLQKQSAAFAAAGRGGIAVVLTPDGEVWTWGRVFGERPFMDRAKRFFAEAATKVGIKVSPPDGTAIYRSEPWQLRNVNPGDSPAEQ